MRVLISADMEGTCGAVSWVHVMPPEYGGEPTNQSEYNRTRLRMTREVNAAIEGALAGGAEEVIVNDSHGGMRNLIPEELHRSCRFISGNDKPLGMMQGVDIDGVEAVFYTGYHARAGTPNAPLAHTWTGWINDVRLDDVSTGEYGINAVVAGHFGVPVSLATGDSVAMEQISEMLGPRVTTVAVKEGLSTFAALHLHPEEAQKRIRAAATEAIRRVHAVDPYHLDSGTVVSIDFDHQARADQAVYIPGVDRGGDRTVTFQPADGLEFISIFRAVVEAASISMSP